MATQSDGSRAALAVEVAATSKTFATRKALDGVSLRIAPGEMAALIGPSGSGKSTLLRACAGLVATDPGSGPIHVNGVKVQEDGVLAPTALEARRSLGFVAQQFNLVGRLSLFTNVMLGTLGRLGFWRGLLGIWPQQDKARAMAALARVGIADYAAQRANTLSGGQQQRGAIARGLVQGARTLFLDEPVASLDPVSARTVMQLVRDLNRQDGVGVVVTLHQIEHARKYCDRIIALRAGKIVYDGSVEGLTPAVLSDVYGAEYDPETGEAAVAEAEPVKAAVRPHNRWLGWLQAAAAAALAAGAVYLALGRETQQADLNFSILATENSQNQADRWEPFLADMRRQTGLSIKPFFGSNYNALVNAMRFNQTQVGWFSNKSGLEAVRQANADVFLRSSDASGVDGYNSVIIVPAQSKLTLDQLLTCDRTLDFGMGDANSTSGTLAPMAYLFAPRDIDPNTCFKTVRSANHEANVRAVANGLLPAATNNTTSLEVLNQDDPALISRIRILWRSPTLPEDPIVVRSDLDPTVRAKMRQFFLTYGRQGDLAQQTRERQILANLSFGLFQPADNTHLLPVREMEATEKLMLAQRSGDAPQLEAARAALEAIRAERLAADATPVQLLANPPLPPGVRLMEDK
jgi:phosphonate transport system substrate-binding protein